MIRNRRGVVLVHCQAGISRSATICIAYLMFYKNITVDQSFDWLKAKRSVISPNLSFMRQLMEFEVQLQDGTAIRREATPTIAQINLNESRKNVSCPEQLPFKLNMPYMPATTTSLPILALPNPLMSSS